MYSVVLVSGVQQSESVTLLHHFFPFCSYFHCYISIEVNIFLKNNLLFF